MSETAAQSTFAVPHQPEYEHTQWAPLCWMILLPALVALFVAGIATGDDAIVPLLFAGGVITIAAFSFQSLRVVDEGNVLALRFGPIPLVRKRISYAEIQAAETDRSNIVDGWGVHWVPGRGWTYNLWGFDCVRLTLTRGRTVRVGTDDPDGLARFLQQKCVPREP